MLFNSISFMVFFPLVTIIYFLIPHKFRWFLLLLASCIFYMFFIPIYILILFITIVIDYYAGMLIEKNQDKKSKNFFLIISILSVCLVLFFFKYFNFFNSNIANIAKILHWNYPIESLRIILPIGLSFHTFQSLSYVIEVYRGKQKAENNFGIYALYVMFYPQLVAGPIERPQNLLHQFYEKHSFDYTRVTDGLKLMLWGFFKKVVIADRLSILVNQVYNNVHDYTGFSLIIATVFFAFQIYCDFSGYSDIAIGSAQVIGFKLMNNFNRPYYSKSINEFWKRWHISLSTWFKDYLYIPLGGNKVPISRMYFNLFITFLISGLWHGANWTFVIWGALNGFYLIFSLLTSNIRNKIINLFKINKNPNLYKIIRIFITFTLVNFAWIFFRANNLNEAIYIIKNLFNFSNEQTILGFFNPDYVFDLGLTKYEIILSLLLILFMELVHLIQRHNKMRQFLSEKPVFIRWVIYYILIFAIFFFGSFNLQEFIYFQF